jgi:hypothetical protein
MYLSVKKVKLLNDYNLELTFENNEIKIFDVKPYLDTGLFKTLKDKNFFRMVKVSYDTIEWPNKVDLDPEVLYAKSKVKVRKKEAI